MTTAQSPGFLIDTSAWIDALRTDGDPEVRRDVRTAVSEGLARFCDMVLLELWNGVRGDSEMGFLKDLERDILLVSTTGEVWAAAGRIAKTCRKKGITVPATDLLIAACADVHQLSLLHNDRHFDLIAQARANSPSDANKPE